MQSSKEVRSTMDFFRHRYYRLIQMSMILLGHWPYQALHIRVAITTVLTSFAISILIPQVMAIVEHIDDWNFLMECAVSLIFAGICFIKSFNSILNSQKILRLLNRIRADWKVLACDRDVNILHEYAEKGRQITHVYIAMGTVTYVLFVTQPVIPKIIDIILKNDTEPGEFPIPVDYYRIDMQKYYFFIVLHCFVYTWMGFFVAGSCDAMLIVSIQHGCGLFAILGRKLQRIGNNKPSSGAEDIAYGADKSDVAVEYLSSCINKHNDAIEYAELINSTYSWSFFFILGLNMLLISVTGIQIILRTNAPIQITKFVFCNVMSMVHLYAESYMAQVLMDHSISIRYYVLNNEWYRLPPKAQKLLPFIMMRCNVPCQLDAAKITVMSVETFGGILKTSISYFTLLRSVQ